METWRGGSGLDGRDGDIELVQHELRLLGFAVDDPPGLVSLSTRQAVRDFQHREGLPATGTVDATTLARLSAAVAALSTDPFRIEGRVLQADGTPVAGEVRLVELRLRGETPLGRATTDAAGRYAIEYEPPADALALQVHAIDAAGAPLASSGRLCAPDRVAVVDLVVGGPFRGPSEYETLERLLLPTVRRAGLLAGDLETDDVELLACGHELDPRHVAFFVLDARLGARHGLPAGTGYALFRQGLPTRLPELLALDPATLRRALDAAVAANVVPARLADTFDATLRRLRDLAVDHAVATPDEAGRFSLAGLLATARLAPAEQTALLNQYVRHDGDVASFWDALRRDPAFGDAGVDRAQLGLQLGAITHNHLPLVDALLSERRVASTRDLARLTVADWEAMIRAPASGGGVVGTPPDVPGRDDDERAANYARVLAAIVEDAFPTAVFADRLTRDGTGDVPGGPDVVRFFTANPDFDFQTHRVDAYLAEHGDAALEGVADPAALPGHLARVRRLFALGPRTDRFAAVRPLLADPDTGSARAIERMGQGAFVARFADAMGGDAAARLVYGNAVQRAASATALFAEFSPAMNTLGMNVIATPPASVPDIPNWEALFGSLDLCSCEGCGSVLSPAAYLVDTLAFLRGNGLLDGCFERRGDIGELELTCANTETPLPYIDLVNELLEQEVTGNAAAHQTRWAADELRAQPEHLDPAAYDTLAGTVFPWLLPFDLWHEEARVYLAQLGVARHEIMRTFQRQGAEPPADDDPPTPSDLAIAAEVLGLTPEDRRVIVGAPRPGEQPRDLWGMDGTDWVENLSELRRFMAQSGLTFEEVHELLATAFANPGGAMEVDFEGVSCDIDHAAVDGLTDEAAGRIHRVVRLARRLGWHVYDVDRALTALGDGRLDDAFLEALAHVLRLHDTLHVPVVELLSWWAPIDTADYAPDPGASGPSLYRRLFLNRAAFDEAALAPFQLAALDDGGDLRDHAAVVTAVLGIGAEDFRRLVPRGASTALTLDNLTRLFRIVSISRAVGLSIADLLSLQGLVDVDPFASPAEADRFVETLRAVQAAGFGVAELAYLLAHREQPGAIVSTSPAAVALLLADIRAGLAKVRTETTPGPEPTGEELRRALALLVPDTVAAQLVALVAGTSLLPDDEQGALIATHGAPFLDDAATVTAQLVGLAAIDVDDQAARVTVLLVPLLAYLRRTESHDLVVQELADALGLPAETVVLLLTSIVRHPDDPRRRALDAFLADDFVTSTSELTASDFPAVFAAHTRLWKATLVVRRLALDPDALRWVHEHREALRLLDLDALPITARSGSSPLLPDLMRLVDVARLRDLVPPGDVTPFDLLGDALAFDAAVDDAEAAEQALLARIAELTAWPFAELQLLAGADGLRLHFPGDYASGLALRRLAACVAMMRRLGASAATLVEWSAPAVSQSNALAIRAALKSRFDAAQWLDVVRSISDALRERRRDALVAYLVGRDDRFNDADDLYERFLIDPAMSACMLTSRVKQAISSVQLFVQRVLLNLEPGLTLSEEATRRWSTWMKAFRRWEVTRKIFLWPENWIVPELRDDKSPLFREMERTLLQNEVRAETVEDAYRHYLEQLSEVARLEIAGVHHQRQGRILHVVGRTRGDPHLYFYRRWVDDARWTPWERVDLDIEGDHLIPVVCSGRLFLLWPTFTEAVPDAEGPTPGGLPKLAPGLDIPIHIELDGQDDEEPQEPAHVWELRMAWSEHRDGVWSVSKSSSPLRLEPEHFVETSRFVFRTSAADDTVDVDVLLDEDGEPDLARVGRCTLSVPRGDVVVAKRGDRVARIDPAHTDVAFMKFAERGSHPLTLTVAEVDVDGVPEPDAALHEVVALRETPGTFQIAYQHQYPQFVSQDLFFYEDDTRAYLVHPRGPVELSDPGLPVPGGFTDPVHHTHGVSPGTVDTLFPAYRAALLATAPATNGDGLTATSSVSALLDEAPAPFALMPLYLEAEPPKRFQFETSYHPFVSDFGAALNAGGVEALLQPPSSSALHRQRLAAPENAFDERHDPTSAVLTPHPREEIDFSYGGAYSLYNWELFFHAPLLIAERLTQNQRFEEALRWLQYVFDPTDRSDAPTPQRYWKVRPFFENDLSDPASRPIQQLMRALSGGNVELASDVAAWRADPFSPHAVARLRPVAYQKNVVMAYLDAVIAWADQLFRRDTIETINEATQLYLLASQLLGPRPTDIAPRHEADPMTFNQLEPQLDTFSNALIEIESHMAILTWGTPTPGDSPPPLGSTLFFCIPPNDTLRAYWDTVADRLFKIRHCMNIEGVVRQLPLFEPPIDPALLVAAAAAGVDIGSVLSDLGAPLPHYRFQPLLRAATAFGADVQSLGAALLAALEKRDAAALDVLHAGHETRLLDAVRAVRESQRAEAEAQRDALLETQRAVAARMSHYASLLQPATTSAASDGEGSAGNLSADVQELLHGFAELQLSQSELDSVQRLAEADAALEMAFPWDKKAANWYMLPTVSASIGFPSGSSVGVSFGGGNLGPRTGTWALLYGRKATQLTFMGNALATKAGYERRREAWQLEVDQARQEGLQIEKQIAAAELRIAIAQQELANHDVQVQNAREVDAFLHERYTGEELYGWLVSQLGTVYFQSYQLAYDLALRAQRALQHELGLYDATFVAFGYWDSLKKGLLSGERLSYDLRRMEAAYLDQNRRELELSKPVSLMQWDPVAVLTLRQTGRCFVNLPETLFDIDYPGHFRRRLRSVSLTIPCVTGPYTTINCTLTLLSNRVRVDGIAGSGYAEVPNDARFRYDVAAVQSIATSSGRNDAGVFELAFRDDRFLPFEGAGAISAWRIELPTAFRQFDYDTISDVILNLDYTARDGGAALRDAATAAVESTINGIVLGEGRTGLHRLLSARREFPTEWHRFLHPAADGDTNRLGFSLSAELFPFFVRGRVVHMDAVELILHLRDGLDVSAGSGLRLALAHPGGSTEFELLPFPALAGVLRAEQALSSGLGPFALDVVEIPIDLQSIDGAGLDGATISDIELVFRYSLAG
jgi:hypothetical protein